MGPPERDGAFVAFMEQALETYARAYDLEHFMMCVAEHPIQLPKKTREPISATQTHAVRENDEYERNRAARILRVAGPLSGFRKATTRS